MELFADKLETAIETAAPPLSADLKQGLTEFLVNYRKAINVRDSLVLAHPFTAAGGIQELGGVGKTWDAALLTEAATSFEDTAIAGNAIFYGDLAKARP